MPRFESGAVPHELGERHGRCSAMINRAASGVWFTMSNGLLIVADRAEVQMSHVAAMCKLW